MKRRAFLWLMGAGLFGALGFATYRSATKSDQILIAQLFGNDIAQHPTTAEFLEEYSLMTSDSTFLLQARSYVRLLLRRPPERRERRILQSFIQSTNVVAYAEGTAQDYIFAGIFDPYELPCGNQLTASWYGNGEA